MVRSAVLALAILGGASLALAFTFAAAWPAVFVAVAAFVLSLEWSAGRSRALLCAALFGWVAYVGGFFWTQPALALFWDGRAALSWAVWLFWGGVVTLRFVVIGSIYCALRRRRVGLVASSLLAWVTVEWLYPSLFPFYLGNTLVDQAVLAQCAALGGPLLLSAWVCGVSTTLAEGLLWLESRRPPARVESSAVVVATLALLLYGSFAIKAVERESNAAPAITVGIVQANVDVIEKRAERLLSHRRYAAQSQGLDAGGSVDLLIWPETSYLRALPDVLPADGTAVRGSLRVPLLFGGIRARTKEGNRERFNSAMIVDADGTIRSAYDKHFLIPFAEFVPFGDRFAAWARLAPTLSHFRAGEDFSALRFGPWRIATPICYETIRPAYVRKLVLESNPHLLVSLTNDGWFGDSPEPHIHLALARLRAIEHRRYLVRATNTGISAVVDPAGRTVAESHLFEATNLKHTVRMLDGPTIYRALGDWPGYLAAFLLLVVLATRRRATDSRRASRRKTPPEPPAA